MKAVAENPVARSFHCLLPCARDMASNEYRIVHVLERGRERFDIHCSPCHGRTGEGNGMIVQRGFPPPPSYHIDRLRKAPAGHFFNVITQGYGVMYSYAGQVEPADRWAIAAYIRVLQLSQNTTLTQLTAEERHKLEGRK